MVWAKYLNKNGGKAWGSVLVVVLVVCACAFVAKGNYFVWCRARAPQTNKYGLVSRQTHFCDEWCRLLGCRLGHRCGFDLGFCFRFFLLAPRFAVQEPFFYCRFGGFFVNFCTFFVSIFVSLALLGRVALVFARHVEDGRFPANTHGFFEDVIFVI